MLCSLTHYERRLVAKDMSAWAVLHDKYYDDSVNSQSHVSMSCAT